MCGSRGARPRTLGAGLIPVVVGTAAAGHVIAWRFAAALLVAAGLQIGVNFANDYFDGVRGVDTHERMGPPRLTQSGAATPARRPRRGVDRPGGGRLRRARARARDPARADPGGGRARPRGGAPLLGRTASLRRARASGELMVFVFFGLMATCGSAYVMVETVPAAAWWSGAVMGFLAVAILVANNLRDIPTDAASGKRTLAVRIGDARTRTLYRACIVAAGVTLVVGVAVFIADERYGITQWALFGLLAWIPAIKPMELVGTATGRDLIPVLSGTALTHAACGLLVASASCSGTPSR